MPQKTGSIIWLALIVIFLMLSGAWLVGLTARPAEETVHYSNVVEATELESESTVEEEEVDVETTVETAVEPEKTSAIAQAAISQVGYIPEIENVTRYHDDLGLEYGSDWCGWFVWWCCLQADREDLVIESPGWAAYWTEEGIIHTPSDGYIPQPGDIVTFDRDGNGNPDHVGIVTGYENGILYTVEGNTIEQGTEEGETPYGVYERNYDSSGWMYVREANDYR